MTQLEAQFLPLILSSARANFKDFSHLFTREEKALVKSWLRLNFSLKNPHSLYPNITIAIQSIKEVKMPLLIMVMDNNKINTFSHHNKIMQYLTHITSITRVVKAAKIFLQAILITLATNTIKLSSHLLSRLLLNHINRCPSKTFNNNKWYIIRCQLTILH